MDGKKKYISNMKKTKNKKSISRSSRKRKNNCIDFEYIKYSIKYTIKWIKTPTGAMFFILFSLIFIIAVIRANERLMERRNL